MSTKESNYFFSYARDDSDFVLRLAKELRAAGANLWLDQLDIVGGDRWDRAVEEAMSSCEGIIVVLSQESVVSNNVMDEVSYALEENKLVVPVLYKECDVPFRLRRVQRIDFTTDYNTGFADLLRALGIEKLVPIPVPAEAETQYVQKVKEPPRASPPDAESKPPEKQVPQRPTEQPAPAFERRNTMWRERMNAALVVAAPLVVFAAISSWFALEKSEAFSSGEILNIIVVEIALSTGLLGAIAGFISGMDRRVIIAALTGGVVGFVIWTMIVSATLPIVEGAKFGLGIGAVLFAIIGRILKKQIGWT